MNLLQKRKLKKHVHLARHLLNHALNMREDIAPASDVLGARSALQNLSDAWKGCDWEHMPKVCDAAQAAAEVLMPPRSLPRWRENVEVLVVAIAMAMACRTYFIQPFKIPTGSMQPTLNGITATPQEGRQLADRFPLNLVNLALFGERYVEVRARNSGTLEYAGQMDDHCAFRIGSELYPVYLAMQPGTPFIDPEQSMKFYFNSGDHVNKGDLIASGRIRQGDHIFVNKVLYNFTQPRRGQIIVFDTNYIPPMGPRQTIRPDTFYIKRLVGLPGEEISIQDRRLVVDGEPVSEPQVFMRQFTDPAYKGYVTRSDSLLENASDVISVGEKQFLPFGDNTLSSLDGRYFGPLSEEALVGPSFFVYWPFGAHWGLSR